MYADIGSQGRISDGGVFKNSSLWQKMSSDSLNLPMPSPLPVVVEIVLRILAARYRIFKKPISLAPEKVSIITMTCILLHNFLRWSETSASIYTPPGTIDLYDNFGSITQPGSWRNEVVGNYALRPINQIPRRSSMNAN